ncbi:MAG: ATP-binding protein, partial [Proteobacteria bacterium]|nr:ATP-binding protein [Pseudomonadota bacterium]
SSGGNGFIYDVDADSDGRWMAERFRGLVFQIEREANQIAKDTRRGKGNFVIVSADVASALSMSGVLDFSPSFNPGMNVDDTGNTMVGTLGNMKVYVDPYATSVNFCCVGYKGTSPYDAGMFYCPYVPLQMVRAVGEQTFQPKIGFKTRYGLVNNPFVVTSAGAITSDPQAAAAARINQYYRVFKINNLHGTDS